MSRTTLEERSGQYRVTLYQNLATQPRWSDVRRIYFSSDGSVDTRFRVDDSLMEGRHVTETPKTLSTSVVVLTKRDGRLTDLDVAILSTQTSDPTPT